LETNEQTRIGMAMIASTIAGAVFASGSAKNEMDLLFIVEQKMQTLFPTVEPKEILLAVSHSLASLNLYRETLTQWDKPIDGGIH
jgi:hypothetical protein